MAYVYILENKDAGCIKIGATTNHPNDRLLDISRMWSAIKGRCQICLNWRMLVDGRMPDHVLTMNHCAGSGQLPLEYSTKLAEEQLIDLQEQLPSLKGGDLNYASRRIKNLQKILQNYRGHPLRLGIWELCASFKIDSAYNVEELVHQALASHLDRDAPFGEVFTCSTDEALEVVKKAIAHFSLKT